MIVTLIIVIVTCAVTIKAWNDDEYQYKFIFNAYKVWHKKEWWRMFTNGLLHADGTHLIFNMITLWSFGEVVEAALGARLYLLFYISALFASSIPDLLKHKDNWGYNALGASGAVSAVLFAAIVLDPSTGVLIMFIPVPIPGLLYGILYIGYSIYMAKNDSYSNIAHLAHLGGAIYGMLAMQLLMNYYNLGY